MLFLLTNRGKNPLLLSMKNYQGYKIPTLPKQSRH